MILFFKKRQNQLSIVDTAITWCLEELSALRFELFASTLDGEQLGKGLSTEGAEIVHECSDPL